jgi:hypothetical protein
MSLRSQIAELNEQLMETTKTLDGVNDVARKWKGLADEREKIIGEQAKKIGDLKERLVRAEAENQRMRGYIQRVQEDDTVAEELVAVGDPSGEQTLVPKRKHTDFVPPNDHSERSASNGMSDHIFDTCYDRDRPKPKHWVRY